MERFAGPEALEKVQAALLQGLGRAACAPQAAMLCYLLRVAPDFGVDHIEAALAARGRTGCFRSLPMDLGRAVPPAENALIEALEDSDPDVAQSAANALGRWGTAAAEPALWARLGRFHEEWAGHETQFTGWAHKTDWRAG